MKIRMTGYRVQRNAQDNRTCFHGCGKPILKGQEYVRAIMSDGSLEIYDKECFRSEFKIAKVEAPESRRCRKARKREGRSGKRDGSYGDDEGFEQGFFSEMAS